MPRYTSVAALEARIKALTKQAERLERGALRGIRAASAVIKRHGLTLPDLRQALAMSGGGRKGTSKLAGRRVPVKYRDDKGNSWTGRGRAPLWLVAAEKAGRKRESFLVAARGARSKAKAKPRSKRAAPKTVAASAK